MRWPDPWPDVSDHDLEAVLASSIQGDLREKAQAEYERRNGQQPVSRGNGVSAPKRRGPTQVEQRMAAVLEMRQRSGEIRGFWFEAFAFRVGAGRSWYRPDFVCRLPDGSFEIIETKGGKVWDDSVKAFKAAALLYPFWRWRMLQWADGGWRTLHDFQPTD